jgi:hypothetical protein
VGQEPDFMAIIVKDYVTFWTNVIIHVSLTEITEFEVEEVGDNDETE